jgi:hypothetical protein
LAAGIARVKSAKSIGVRTVNRLPAGAGAPNAPDIATTQGQRGCGRCPGAFTPEATVAARPADAPELSV